MKIATFNINNVNRRLPNLLDWLKAAEPDVACLQELKAEDRAFPEAALREAGYHAVWKGERSWNGVAILARGAEPVPTRRSLPGDASDKHARYIEAAVNGVLVVCIYLPNGNPQPGPKFDYKLAWFERLITHAATLFATDAPVILAGDFNVVPTSTSTTRAHGRRTRCSSPRSGCATGGSSNRGRQIHFERSTRPNPCLRFGSISGSHGRATPGYGWTTFC